MRLQALGRGVLGRRIARAQRQRLAAVLLQALVRGHVCRLDFVKKRHLVIRVQAFVRMKIQQRKHMKARLERAMEADMTYQLKVLQEPSVMPVQSIIIRDIMKDEQLAQEHGQGRALPRR